MSSHSRGFGVRPEEHEAPAKRAIVGSVDAFLNEKQRRSRKISEQIKKHAKKYARVSRKETLGGNSLDDTQLGGEQGPKRGAGKTKKFDEEALDKFVEDYMQRTHQSSTQGSGKFRATHASIMGASRLSQAYQEYKGARDSRSMQNYERNMRIWKANARCLSTKLGRKNPDSSLMSSQDL